MLNTMISTADTLSGGEMVLEKCAVKTKCAEPSVFSETVLRLKYWTDFKPVKYIHWLNWLIYYWLVDIIQLHLMYRVLKLFPYSTLEGQTSLSVMLP